MANSQHKTSVSKTSKSLGSSIQKGNSIHLFAVQDTTHKRLQLYQNQLAAIASIDSILMIGLSVLVFGVIWKNFVSEPLLLGAVIGLTMVCVTISVIATDYYKLEESHHCLGKVLPVMLGVSLPTILLLAFTSDFYHFLIYGSLLSVFSVMIGLISACVHYKLGQGFQLFTTNSQFYGLEQKLKRGFDIVASGLGLLVLSPLLLLVAAAVCLESDGSPLYAQIRIGLNQKTFKMWKFRSMVKDASRLEQQRLPVLFKSEDDPRITFVGRIIRKLSIDELPQLWNILMGDMSLVGPRPPIEEEFAVMTQRHKRKFEAPQGVTGFWQITGRVNNQRDFDSVAHYDTVYIDHWSLMKDMIILFRTIPVVLFQKGAY